MAQTFSSEKFTETSKKIEFFSDFTPDFDIHPGKKDLARVINEDSVKRSIRNLILTNTGERLFQPNLGSNISRVLFELADNDALDLAQEQIISTLRVYEPRAKIIDVIANLSPDSNSMSITIKFSVINTGKTTTLGLILFRAR